MRPRAASAAACFAAVVLSLTCPARSATSDQIDKAIADARDYLYSQQKDGTWERDFDKRGDQSTGQTALVVCALLATGQSPQDPRIAKAIEYLKTNETSGVYALGMRCQAWQALPQSPEVKATLAKDAKALLSSILAEGSGKGFYGYNP